MPRSDAFAHGSVAQGDNASIQSGAHPLDVAVLYAADDELLGLGEGHHGGPGRDVGTALGHAPRTIIPAASRLRLSHGSPLSSLIHNLRSEISIACQFLKPRLDATVSFPYGKTNAKESQRLRLECQVKVPLHASRETEHIARDLRPNHPRRSWDARPVALRTVHGTQCGSGARWQQTR
jgi:hypothetical protein